MGVILDTSILIETERAGTPLVRGLEALLREWGDVPVMISVITAYELLHGVWRARTPVQRAQRDAFVEEVLARIPSCPVTLPVARVAAQVDAELRAGGITVATADLLIGATALALDFDVATRNPRDFARIPGLGLR